MVEKGMGGELWAQGSLGAKDAGRVRRGAALERLSLKLPWARSLNIYGEPLTDICKLSQG